MYFQNNVNGNFGRQQIRTNPYHSGADFYPNQPVFNNQSPEFFQAPQPQFVQAPVRQPYQNNFYPAQNGAQYHQQNPMFNQAMNQFQAPNPAYYPPQAQVQPQIQAFAYPNGAQVPPFVQNRAFFNNNSFAREEFINKEMERIEIEAELEAEQKIREKKEAGKSKTKTLISEIKDLMEIIKKQNRIIKNLHSEKVNRLNQRMVIHHR